MLALGGCAKQYEDYGYISPNLLLFTWGTGMYLNACAKVSSNADQSLANLSSVGSQGEQYIPQTWGESHTLSRSRIQLTNEHIPQT